MAVTCAVPSKPAFEQESCIHAEIVGERFNPLLRDPRPACEYKIIVKILITGADAFRIDMKGSRTGFKIVVSLRYASRATKRCSRNSP